MTDVNSPLHFGSNVDDYYVVVGAHIDSSLKEKIAKGKYIDFARLLPREKSQPDDGRLKLINKGGQTYFIPAVERESAGVISSFNKWEQTFRVFSNVILQYFPERVTELIQYNHVIFTASLSYAWDNVYNYDKEFRAHIGNYPNHSWAIILQQAWSMCLKDKIANPNLSGKPNGKGGKREICKHFNRGQCTAGGRCQFDHRCLGCGKFGHGIHISCNKSSNVSGGSDGATPGTSQGNQGTSNAALK